MDASNSRPPGWGSTLRAGLNAGLLAGAMLGVLDALVAGVRTSTSGAGTWVGCIGSAVVLYGIFWTLVMLALALPAHWFLRRRSMRARMVVLASIALGLGLFLELYWWSRPYIFPGRAAEDPRRLAAMVALAGAGLVLGALVVAAGRRLPRVVLWAGAALVPVLWIAGLIALPASHAAVLERGEVNERNRELPNVLLFVVDALRHDVLGCYGNERVQTPHLDALAARGVLFERAYVQAPFTWSSFGSILTGKYPRRHGLVKMAPGVRMVPNITLPWHLKSARKLGGVALQPDDYAGSTFMTGTLSHGSGLLRGFDTYFEEMVGHDVVVADVPWSKLRSELVLSLLWTKLRGKWLKLQSIDPVAHEARQWLARHGQRRFVTMVHFYSTHTPYDPAPRFREMYVDPAYDGPIHAFFAEYREAIEQGQYALTEADRRQIENLYHGGVSQADAMIGDVLAELERQGTLDNTLVIVTADHGEELGDHGLWEHNFMYDTNLQVPLLMALPGKLPAGRRVPAIVESVDLVPTICALMGLEPPHEPGLLDEKGRDRGAIDGVDLLALIRGEVERVKEHAFAENGRYLAVRDERFKLVVPMGALHEEGWKEALAGTTERPQLFDLARDPLEKDEALERHPEEALRLLEVLRAWDASMPVPRTDMAQSQRDIEAEARRLQALGYAGGVGQGAEAPVH